MGGSEIGATAACRSEFATSPRLEELDLPDPDKIFQVRLADLMWNETKSVQQRITTARYFRVFPGEGAHGQIVL